MRLVVAAAGCIAQKQVIATRYMTGAGMLPRSANAAAVWRRKLYHYWKEAGKSSRSDCW